MSQELWGDSWPLSPGWEEGSGLQLGHSLLSSVTPCHFEFRFMHLKTTLLTVGFVSAS